MFNIWNYKQFQRYANAARFLVVGVDSRALLGVPGKINKKSVKKNNISFWEMKK